MGAHGAGQKVVQHSAGLALRQGVGGNPIRPLAEDVGSVHAECQGESGLVLAIDHFQRAESDPFADRIPGHCHGQVIQGLGPVTAWPPSFGVMDRQADVQVVDAGFECYRFASLLAGDGNLQCGGAGGYGMHVDINVEINPVPAMMLRGCHVFGSAG